MVAQLAQKPSNAALPGWRSVLAVVAHPDDESFGLGGVLDAFAKAGARVSVLSLTQGEASTLGQATESLATLRTSELRAAADALGVHQAELRSFPDGRLAEADRGPLVREITDTVRATGAEGLVVFEPSGVSGHPDHAAATAAALEAAATADLPVLGWYVPLGVADQLNRECETAFTGLEPGADDLVLHVDRERQLVASLAHASQAVPGSVLWRRLELLGDAEHLRWLRRPSHRASDGGPRDEQRDDVATMRVEYRDGDRFDIFVRDHVVTVDQPVEIGGDDEAPTPTELFVASLASCVAFYARRYLRRHKFDPTGLAVETSFRMGTKPARVADVELRLVVPVDLPEVRRAGLLAAASHCTVHNSITTAPAITVAYADGA